MKLAKDIIRINGWKDGKRTHIDIKVKMVTVEFTDSTGKEHSVEAPSSLFNAAQTGFDNGLDAVTSYNYYNWVGKERMTIKVI